MKTSFGMALAFTFLLSACDKETPNLVPLPPNGKVITAPLQKVFRPEVDILLVIDDSGSMGSHQKNLSLNAYGFASEITKFRILEYQIGVITTDTDDPTKRGRLQGYTPFVDKKSLNPVDDLSRRMLVGTMGSGWEHPFEAIEMAFTSPTKDTHNKGFLRDEAFLAVIIVTDTEDQSDGISSKNIHDFLVNLKAGRKDMVAVHGVIIPSSATDCSRDGPAKPEKIEALISDFQGYTFNLCDPNFGANLATIGDDVGRRSIEFLPLEQVPIVETIVLRYGTQVIPNDPRYGWVYDPRRVGLRLGPDLVFDENQAQGTELEISFEIYKP